MRSNRDLQSRYKMSDLDYHYRAIEEAMGPIAQDDRSFTFAKRFLSIYAAKYCEAF